MVECLWLELSHLEVLVDNLHIRASMPESQGQKVGFWPILMLACVRTDILAKKEKEQDSAN